MNLEDKINIVKSLLKDKKVAIGFSGGADSTLMAYLSSEVAKDTIAITIDNHLMPTDFISHAKSMCDSFGIKHEIIDINFYEDQEFLQNSPSRCYTCRDMMYSQIKSTALKKGFDYICDGNNISDLVNDRPGILITYKQRFETPLIKAKLTSKEIHEYLDKNNIPYSKSTTCLATRIPTNTKTDKEKIERISQSEDYILDTTDCKIVKVRDFGEIGIIEVDDIDEILSNDKFRQINDELKGKGYRKIALNLSQIDDDEFINIDYNDGSFSYQLPFTINLEETSRQITGKINSITDEKIVLDNITIFETGLIEGNNLKTKEIAIDTFMEILQKLRRNI